MYLEIIDLRMFKSYYWNYQSYKVTSIWPIKKLDNVIDIVLIIWLVTVVKVNKMLFPIRVLLVQSQQ